MLRRIATWLFGSSRSQMSAENANAEPSAAECFRQAFGPELAKIEAQRAAHAQVRPSLAELEARVTDALRRGLSA